jgi:hypothetical protein
MLICGEGISIYGPYVCVSDRAQHFTWSEYLSTVLPLRATGFWSRLKPRGPLSKQTCLLPLTWFGSVVLLFPSTHTQCFDVCFEVKLKWSFHQLLLLLSLLPLWGLPLYKSTSFQGTSLSAFSLNDNVFCLQLWSCCQFPLSLWRNLSSDAVLEWVIPVLLLRTSLRDRLR